MKKMPNGSGEKASGDDTKHNEGYSNTVIGDSRNGGTAAMEYRSTPSMPIVDFGDPRSLTQGISFKRKRGPSLAQTAPAIIPIVSSGNPSPIIL